MLYVSPSIPKILAYSIIVREASMVLNLDTCFWISKIYHDLNKMAVTDTQQQFVFLKPSFFIFFSTSFTMSVTHLTIDVGGDCISQSSQALLL